MDKPCEDYDEVEGYYPPSCRWCGFDKQAHEEGATNEQKGLA